jgi:hypothetical protein
MSTKRKNNTKRKNIKKRRTQKGGYKYSDSPSLDSRSEEITSSNKNYNKNKSILKTRKRSVNKSRK